MATISITIADDKVNSISNDLENIFERPASITNLQFIKHVLLTSLRAYRKQGRIRKTINNTDLPDSDIAE